MPSEEKIQRRLCHVHGQELLSDTAELFPGYRTYAPDPERERFYPNAADRPICIGNRDPKEFSTTVWYCQECRASSAEVQKVWRAAWEVEDRARRENQKRIARHALTRTVTLFLVVGIILGATVASLSGASLRTGTILGGIAGCVSGWIVAWAVARRAA